MGGFDQRKAMRVPVARNLQFWPASGDEIAPRIGKTVNLSETGLAFRTDAGLPGGEILEVRLMSLDQEAFIEFQAVVVHSQAVEKGQVGSAQYEIRARYQHLSPASLQAILDMMEEVVGSGNLRRRQQAEDVPNFRKPAALKARFRPLEASELQKILENKNHLNYSKIASAPQFQNAARALAASLPEGGLGLKSEIPLESGRAILAELILPGLPFSIESLAQVKSCHPEEEGKYMVDLKVISVRKDDALRLETGP